jgi:hypothetical protein
VTLREVVILMEWRFMVRASILNSIGCNPWLLCSVCSLTQAAIRRAPRVCVRTAKAKLQRLKPHSFCGVFVVAEATTHKHSRMATQTLHKYSRVATYTLHKYPLVATRTLHAPVWSGTFSVKLETAPVLRRRLANSVPQSELSGCGTWQRGGNGEFNLGGEIPMNDSCVR